MAHAAGKYAKAISDRSGMEFPYKEMVREWNGSFVHVSEFEPKQPQLEPKPMNGDSISLRHVRPGRNEPTVAAMLGNNPFSITAASQTITVTEPNHGTPSSTEVCNDLRRASPANAFRSAPISHCTPRAVCYAGTYKTVR